MPDYPSVTTVLAPYSGLDRINPFRLAHAADRGTRVHNYTASYSRKIWIPMNMIPEDCQGYVISFRLWFDAFVTRVYMVEGEVVDDTYRYVGHPDLIASIRPYGRIAVLDSKTPIGSPPRTWRGQIAAYIKAARLQGIKAEMGGPLQLDPGGKMGRVKDWIQPGEVDVEFVYFLNALSAHHYYAKGGNKE